MPLTIEATAPAHASQARLRPFATSGRRRLRTRRRTISGFDCSASPERVHRGDAHDVAAALDRLAVSSEPVPRHATRPRPGRGGARSVRTTVPAARLDGDADPGLPRLLPREARSAPWAAAEDASLRPDEPERRVDDERLRHRGRLAELVGRLGAQRPAALGDRRRRGRRRSTRAGTATSYEPGSRCGRLASRRPCRPGASASPSPSTGARRLYRERLLVVDAVAVRRHDRAGGGRRRRCTGT